MHIDITNVYIILIISQTKSKDDKDAIIASIISLLEPEVIRKTKYTFNFPFKETEKMI